MREIAPSILSADFGNLRAEVEKIEKTGLKYLHLDSMDGIFVPNLTFGAPIIKAIRKGSNMIFDTHLMISEPIRYVEDYAKAGADIITVHIEACKNVGEVLTKIKSLGKKTGISIKPNTKTEELAPFLGEVDLVLVMSVEPGFGGQKFIENAIGKIEELAAIKKAEGYHYIIEVDGGINRENRERVFSAGAELLVMGSAFFAYEDYNRAVRELG